jgi:hypothetical protein
MCLPVLKILFLVMISAVGGSEKLAVTPKCVLEKWHDVKSRAPFL